MFPRQNTSRNKRVGIIVGFSSGGLPSTLRDVAHLFFILKHKWSFGNLKVILETRDEVNKVRVRLSNLCDEYKSSNKTAVLESFRPIIPKNKSEFLLTLSSSVAKLEKSDIFVSLSCHGYSMRSSGSSPNESDGRDEYIKFRGSPVKDDDLHRALVGTLPDKKNNMFVLVDTCHSGTMIDLKYNKLTKQKEHNFADIKTSCDISSFSGCSDSQLSRDDISYDFGFGGGLTSAFLDSCAKLPDGFNICTTFSKISKPLNKMGQKPQWSTNKL